MFRFCNKVVLMVILLSLFWGMACSTADPQEKISQYERKRIASEELITFLNSPQEKIRKKTVIALGRIQEKLATSSLLIALEKEKDLQIKYEIIFALGQIGDKKALPALLNLLKNPEDAETSTLILEALGKIKDPETVPVIAQIMTDTKQNPLVRQQAALSLGRISQKESISYLQKGLFDLSPEVRTACAWGICRFLTIEPSRKKELTLSQDLRKVISTDNDKWVRFFAVRSLALLKKEDTVSFLKDLLNDEFWGVQYEAWAGLRVITGREYPLKLNLPAVKPLPADVLTLAKNNNPVVVIETDKGLIALELFPEEAPVTVNNFLKLTKEGFYNGLKFHRVIRGFMVQGGDPAGDGSGGPGYKIVTEISRQLHHKIGVISMASSGKDTEGSQFFITQVPCFHLDGNYTAFGKVIWGQEVVDNIERDDTIKTIKILR